MKPSEHIIMMLQRAIAKLPAPLRLISLNSIDKHGNEAAGATKWEYLPSGKIWRGWSMYTLAAPTTFDSWDEAMADLAVRLEEVADIGSQLGAFLLTVKMYTAYAPCPVCTPTGKVDQECATCHGDGEAKYCQQISLNPQVFATNIANSDMSLEQISVLLLTTCHNYVNIALGWSLPRWDGKPTL